MVETYTILKTIHVLAAVLWVGGNLTMNVLGTRVVNAHEPAQMLAFTRDAEWIGQRVYLPASVTVLLFGIFAVLEGEWSFGDPWVSIGLAGLLVTAVTGSAFFGPELKRIRSLAQRRGVDDAEVQQRTARLIRFGRIDSVILTLIIVDMVIKPGAG